MYPLIVYDFETCNDYTFKGLNQKASDARREIISSLSYPMDVSLMYVEKPGSKPVYTKFKFKFPKSFDSCSDYEQDGLRFYFKHLVKGELNDIKIRQLLQDHNENSLSLYVGFGRFINFIKKYVGTDINDDRKFNEFTLIGKNNHNFDDLILNYYLNFYYPQYLTEILQSSWDLQKFITDQRDWLHFSDSRLKFFTFYGEPIYDRFGNRVLNNRGKPIEKGAYTLENIYLNLFKKPMVGAHDSKYDVYATLKIFEFYYERFPDLIHHEKQATYLDVKSQIKSYSDKEEVI